MLAFLGCGSGGDGPEGAIAITSSPEIDGYLDALCTFEVRAGAYPKKLPCAQAIMGNGGRTLIDLVSAIRAGTVAYHPDMAKQCAAEALSLPCTKTGYDKLWNDCLLAFEATTAADGSCHSNYECLPGTECSGACAGYEVVSCCTGTCAPASTPINPRTIVRVGDGEACADAGPYCENLTSYCDPTSNTCQPRLAVGAKCDSDACIGYAFCSVGTCKKRPGLGEGCKLPEGGFAKCLVGACDQHDVCSMTNFVVQCF
jgi:hypothetical protein